MFVLILFPAFFPKSQAETDGHTVRLPCILVGDVADSKCMPGVLSFSPFLGMLSKSAKTVDARSNPLASFGRPFVASAFISRAKKMKMMPTSQMNHLWLSKGLSGRISHDESHLAHAATAS